MMAGSPSRIMSRDDTEIRKKIISHENHMERQTLQPGFSHNKNRANLFSEITSHLLINQHYKIEHGQTNQDSGIHKQYAFVD